MDDTFSVASFTKNFSWNESYKRLHSAIRNGFHTQVKPVTRREWRKASQINDRDLELIPINFFLYSKKGMQEDYLLVDRLVEKAVHLPYDQQFAKLALFAFHLANSGFWKRSLWPDGRVAGWANQFIRERVWRSGAWAADAFDNQLMEKFINDHVDGKSTRKVFTNYRFMLRSAGILNGRVLQTPNFRERWFVDAIQLFWDRQIFDGNLSGVSSSREFEIAFYNHDVHKLLGCDTYQAKSFISFSFREYQTDLLDNRLQQLQILKSKLAA